MISTEPATVPESIDDFIRRLSALSGQIPKRLQQCADHIAVNLDRIAVSTVAELAEGAGVQPSALMRFCQLMGFSGFSDMQRLFRDAYGAARPDYATRLRNLQAGGAATPAALLAEFIEAGRHSLAALADQVNEIELEKSVRALASARVIHLVGYRRAYPVAVYLAYAFDRMGISSLLHDGAGHLDRSQAIGAQDALIAISFAPYSAETAAMAAAAEAKGAAVVALTDRLTSPVAHKARAILTVQETDFGAFRSLSATLALSMALAVAVGAAREG